MDLKSFLISDLSKDVSQSSAHALGRAIGLWLRSFHSWAARPEQAECKDFLKGNKLKGLKHYINYSMLLETIPNFPAILEADRSTFEKVRDYAATEPQEAEHGSDYGVIHGDFWTGKYVKSYTGQSLFQINGH